MSSILKALKKLEEEKNTPHPYEFRINSDILKGEVPQRKKTFSYLLLGLLLFAGGATAAYIYLKLDQTNGNAKKSGQSQTNPAPSIPSSIEVPRKEADLKTEVLPESIKIVPASKHDVVKPKNNDRIAKGGNSAISKTVVPKVQNKVDQHKRISTDDALHSRSQQGSGAVPALRVNGIAYQDGTSDNMAIINGVPVSDGSMVEGVIVEKIFKDRVRFNRTGEMFEIPLGKSNR